MPARDQPTTASTKKAAPKPRAKAAGARQPAVKAKARQSSTPKQQDRTGSRRNDIVRAAAETFYRKGYDATTTQDIAESVGMLKGSLYYYISAKEDLLYEIIDEVHEVWAKNLERNEIMQGDPLTRIWAFVHNNVIGTAMNLVNSAVFFRDFGALTGRRREHILALRDLHDNSLRELIREGQADGLVRKGVDAKLAATGILTMCNSLYHWYRPDGVLTAEAVADAYADMAVASLTARPELLASSRKRAKAAPVDLTTD
jgi:AcrR family transcriptional regulator